MLNPIAQEIAALDEIQRDIDRLRELNAGEPTIPPILFKEHPDRSRWDGDKQHVFWKWPEQTWLKNTLKGQRK